MYEHCTPRERDAVDALMTNPGKPICDNIARLLGISVPVVKAYLSRVYDKYGIYDKKYCPIVRLAYLRAKELGLC